MGYVLKDIKAEFGDDTEISIITRPENIRTMETFPEVDKTLTFTGHAFTLLKEYRLEIDSLKQDGFDIAIIPSNGNIESYDNVVAFSKEVFGEIPIYFHLYPKTFTLYQYSLSHNLLKVVLKVIAGVATFPVFILYFLVLFCMLILFPSGS